MEGLLWVHAFKPLGWVRMGLCPQDHSEANGGDTRKMAGTGPALVWIRGERGWEGSQTQLCAYTPLGGGEVISPG